jgi:hypothetical protein
LNATILPTGAVPLGNPVQFLTLWPAGQSRPGVSRRDTGDSVATIRALLDSGAILPEHAQDLEPSDAVLEMLP